MIDVDLVVALLGADPGGRDRLDRALAQVDERHVVAVEGFVVVDAEHEPLAADRVAARRQRLRDLGVVDGAADHLPEQLGARLVRLEVDEHVAPRARRPEALLVEHLELLLPRRLEDLALRGLRGAERAAEAGDARERRALAAPEVVGVRLEALLQLRVDHAPVARGTSTSAVRWNT